MAMASLPVGASRDDPAVERFLSSKAHLQTVQRSGSAALNLACVASGRIDVFWSSSLKPWDQAAGILLVQEAGGMVTAIEGGAVDVMIPSLLSTSSRMISESLITVLN
jgi:myo-inositol-1(or 4)-monophosphatase